jgi:dTDP-4-dehydrorhamnose 3,5-epimerase
MNAIETGLPGVLILEPEVLEDERGFFMESWNASVFSRLTGYTAAMVQDNHAHSARGVLRGLHYQLPPMSQGKLVRVAAGEIYDVAVDLRRGSPTFGRWTGVVLNSENRRQLWIPPGFAQGFYTLSETSEVLYKVTATYSPAHERAVRWDDPDLGIRWPLVDNALPRLSAKDTAARRFRDAEIFE